MVFQNISITFKGGWTSLILIERLRILIHEKVAVVKSEIKKLNENKRLTHMTKSGNIR